VRPLKNKTSAEVLKAFKNIIKEADQKPYSIVCDKGSEFVNKDFKAYCKDSGIKLRNPKSFVHAAYIERFNRTLQLLIHKDCSERQTRRYINNLPKLVKTYNERMHRSIGMSPHEAENNPAAPLIINNYISKREVKMKKRDPTINIGSTVRISKQKNTFSRGYDEQTKYEIFKIKSIDTKHKIPLYHLTNYEEDEDVEGGFYAYELTPVNIDTFRIEKIIRHRIRNGKKKSS